jgi:hypothetical protein
MEKSPRTKSKTSKFEPGEHIRVVPLHHPKPVVAIGAREPKGGDLFDGKPHPAAASAKLTYRGGALLTNVKVFTVFWGKLWGSNKTSIKMMSDINKFFTAILVSPAVDQLAEYSVANQTIGHGSLIGTKTISVNAPVGSVTDSTIRKQLKQWIKANTVPKPTKNTLYFIYLDPKVISIMGGSRSCQSYCGYHDNVGSVYYAVMPYPTCSGCLGGHQAFDALTGTSTHELCEAITDPVPGAGWYDDAKGEIGDICAWNFKQVAGYNVQLEWSNKANKCV